MSAPLTPATASSSSASAAKPIASSIALGDTTATASGSTADAAPTSKSLTAATANGANRSEERRVGKECRSRCDWSSDVCSSDLVFNRTWGYDRDRIWVDRGCRADFEIVDRRDREWREWSRDWNDDDRRGWDRDRDRYRDRDRDDRDRDRDRNRDRDDYRDRPPLLN